jgi:hypothetical protein
VFANFLLPRRAKANGKVLHVLSSARAGKNESPGAGRCCWAAVEGYLAVIMSGMRIRLLRTLIGKSIIAYRQTSRRAG